MEMAKLGEQIILVKAGGYMRSIDEDEFLACLEDYRIRYFPENTSLIAMEDFSGIQGAEAEARKKYVAYFKDNDFLIGGIIYNLSPLFKISFNLAKRLQIYGKDMYAEDSYADAVERAIKIIHHHGRERLHYPNQKGLRHLSPLKSGLLYLKIRFYRFQPEFRRFKLNFLSSLNRSLTRHYSDVLLKYIASIDWQQERVSPEASPKYSDPAINQVFDAVGFIKSEIDRLIQERLQAEQELRESEARYRQLVEHAKAGILQFNRDTGCLESFNDVLFDITGYTRAEITSMSVFDLMTEESQIAYKQRYDRLLAGEAISPDAIYQLVTKNGEIRWVLINTNRPFLDGKPDIANVVLSDITELKRIENQFLEYQSKLKSLSVRLSKTQEDERRRLASRLHDSVSQELFGVHLMLNTFEKKLGNASHSQEVRRVKDQIQKVIKDTKTLTFDLSPPVLYDFGLQEALETLAASIEDKYGISIKSWFSGSLDEVGDEMRIILYRIISELMMNTVKHANAREIRISLNNSDHLMTVDFEDDGIGFDAEQMHTETFTYEGFGIFDIREKISHLGGNIVIDSTPGSGTAIMMEVPMMGNPSNQQAAGE